MSRGPRRRGTDSSSKMHLDERRSGVFENLHGQLAADGWEILEENLQRVTGLQVLEKNPDWNARPDEHRGATEDLGVGDYAG
jgi:hypothetical protein